MVTLVYGNINAQTGRGIVVISCGEDETSYKCACEPPKWICYDQTCIKKSHKQC